MTPDTEAGRALLADWMNDDVLNRLPPRGLVSEQIAAIEAEARSLAIDRAVEAVKELNDPEGFRIMVNRAAVIEKLESLR